MKAPGANSIAIDARSGDRRARNIVFAALAILMAMQLLRPGDAAFINDEPNLIGKAIAANEHGRLAPHGLLGSLGVEYSPVCVWFYQLLLTITSSLLWITAIKTAIVWSCVWAALWRIDARLHLSPWPLLLIPLSPEHWFYQRLLWDNVFLIPISAAMVAVLAGFLEKPSTLSLAILAALSVLAFHVHVLAAVPIAACALTLIVFRSGWFRAHKAAAIAVGLAALAVSARYLHSIVFERVESYHPHPDMARSLSGSAQGFMNWSHEGFESFIAAFYRDLPGARLWQSGTGWLALGAGIAAFAWFVLWMFRRAPALREWKLDAQLAFLAAALVLGQIVLLIGLRLEPFWHYFNGVWFGYFYLLWWGFDRVSRRAWARALLALQIAAVGVLTTLMALFVHAHHGDRTQVYGATLENQMEVAGELALRRPESVSFEVENYTLYPHALKVLVRLQAPGASPPFRAGSSQATVKYAEKSGDDGRIVVEFSDAGGAKPR